MEAKLSISGLRCAFLPVLVAILGACASSGAPLVPPEPAPLGPGELDLPATPFTVPPQIRNPTEFWRDLSQAYPPLLRDSGITGTATLLLAVDSTGSVLQRRLYRTSGERPLDQAALDVADALEFSPALDGEEPVMVWVTLAIPFDERAGRPRRAKRREVPCC